MGNPDAVKECVECLLSSYEMAIEDSHVLANLFDINRLAQADVDRIVIDLGGIAYCLRIVISTIAARGLMEMDK